MIKVSSNFYFYKGLKIKVDPEILRYYLWHVYRCPYENIGQMIPKYGAHVSVVLPLHGEKKVEKSEIYSGQSVDFYYDGYIKIGGNKIINNRRHRNFWIPIYCPRADEVKKELNIVGTNYYGFHITISNNKNFIKQF